MCTSIEAKGFTLRTVAQSHQVPFTAVWHMEQTQSNPAKHCTIVKSRCLWAHQKLENHILHKLNEIQTVNCIQISWTNINKPRMYHHIKQIQILRRFQSIRSIHPIIYLYPRIYTYHDIVHCTWYNTFYSVLTLHPTQIHTFYRSRFSLTLQVWSSQAHTLL